MNEARPNPSSNTLDFKIAAKKTVNAVVHIKSQYNSNYDSDPMMDFFWGPGGSRGMRQQVATGSGVIISNDGYVVTNNHVIDGAEKISITLNDGRELNAEIIGTDPNTDIALLKVEEKNLPYTEFGNSDDVHLGDWVLAVGNPFNLTSTVTAGIVSAKARNINILKNNSRENIFPLESFIQTDAAVNPGNSGGALVTPKGLLIGINTAIASKTGSYSGYSFAIPSNIALKVVNDLKSYGMVQRAFIGVIIEDVTQNVMNKLDLPNTEGVLVNGLSEGGAASDAGIEVNDIIISVENISVNDVPELQEQIGKFKPGDKVNLVIRRDGETRLVSVTLRNQSGNTRIIDKRKQEAESTIYGAIFQDLNKDEMMKLRIAGGAKIKSIKEGKIKNAGLKKGFIITHIDKNIIKSKKELIKTLNSKKGGVLIEGIYPNGVKGYFGFGT
jgi:Do/DeqQ family serine protease